MKRFMVILFVLALLLMGCDSGTTVSESTSVDDKSTEKAAEATNKVAAEAEDDEPGMVESTFSNLKEAMAAAVPMKCTWSWNDGQGEASGEIIVSGKKHSYEMEVMADGQTFKSYGISDGKYMYIWSNQQAQGMKMEIPEDTDDYDMPDSGSGQAIDMEANYNYKCMPTTVSPGTFSPPGNVDFMDMSEMMGDMEALAAKYQME